MNHPKQLWQVLQIIGSAMLNDVPDVQQLLPRLIKRKKVSEN